MLDANELWLVPSSAGGVGVRAIHCAKRPLETYGNKVVHEKKETKKMNRLNTITKIAFFVAVLVLYLPPGMRADFGNERTSVTFSAPVEIPGQVLPAGTYIFQLADSISDRRIVQIWNKDQSHLYATILAVPDFRMQPTGNTVIKFEERAAEAPEAIRAWYYPGEQFGQKFVYPKLRAVELAKQNNVPVPSMPEEMAANTTNTSQSAGQALRTTPLKAQQPSGEEIEIAEFAQNPAAKPNSLPRTASDLPLLALTGMAALGLAAGLGLVSKRMI